jgi:hypothetical protein
VTAVIDSEQCDDEDTFVGRCYTLKALLWARGVVACGWAKPLQLLSRCGTPVSQSTIITAVCLPEVTRTVITVGVAEATGAGEDNGIDHNKN